MASVNKWLGIGNLGRDPELRYFPDGGAVASFTLACNESWKDKTSGEKKESVEWVRCAAHGKLAEIVGQYLKKGSPVYVEGRLRTRKYQKDGVDHWTTEINVQHLVMLGQRREQDEAQTGPASRDRAPSQDGGGVFAMEDDIPF